MKKMNMRKKEAIHGLLFVSPWIIGFLVFTLFPICSSLYYSLCDYQVIKDPVFIGLDNYKMLFQDKTFLKAMSNTVYMIIFGVPITTFIAVAVSIIMNNKKLKYTGPFRVAFFIPTPAQLYWDSGPRMAFQHVLVKACADHYDGVDLRQCHYYLSGRSAGYTRQSL